MFNYRQEYRSDYAGVSSSLASNYQSNKNVPLIIPFNTLLTNTIIKWSIL